MCAVEARLTLAWGGLGLASTTYGNGMTLHGQNPWKGGACAAYPPEPAHSTLVATHGRR